MMTKRPSQRPVASRQIQRALWHGPIVVLLLGWLTILGCPRPPAALPLESFSLDAHNGGDTDSHREMHPDLSPDQTDQTTQSPDPQTELPDQVAGDHLFEPAPEQSSLEMKADNPTQPPDTATESHKESTPESATESTPEPSPCPSPPTREAVDLIQQWRPLGFATQPQPYVLPRCGMIGFRMVVPAQMEIQIDITGLPRQYTFALATYNARRINQVAQDPAIATQLSANQTYISLKWKVPQSGEVGVVLYGWQHPTPQPFQIQAFCTKQCQRSATRFPIVLMHGFAGTDKYFGLLDYFYQVTPHLESRGFAVFTPKVQPIANSQQRVLSLKKQIDDIFDQTGARKLNLIAHSQGGVDGRLLISSHQYHDKIASLTTISTPHRGIPIPNLLLPPSQELGESNMQQYNVKYPDHPQVKYFSWAGVSCGILDATCRKKYNNETVDLLLTGTYEALKALRGPNDGIVPLSSAKWGTFLGEIPADHFDEIGQVADKNNKSFDHKDFYLSEAKRLQALDF